MITRQTQPREASMAPFLWQTTGLTLLVLAVLALELALHRRTPLARSARLARLIVLITGVGGAVGAPAWWQDLPWAFSWDLPPLASRYLAVAALAFSLASARALIWPTAAHQRQVFWLILVYLGPLTGAILTLHLDRVDLATPAVRVFFVIVITLLVGSAMALILNNTRPPRLPLRAAESGIALVAGLWGLALFAWPDGPSPLIWPWAADALTSRLIASMFLTVSAAFVCAADTPSRRSALWIAAVYGVGVAGCTGIALALGRPAPMLYLLGWGLIGAVALWRITADASARAPAPNRQG